MRWKTGLSVVAVVAIAGGLLAAPLDAPEDGWVGLTLQQALSRLNDQGLAVVFSTALVRPEMRVEREPRAGDARGILQEILEPYGLHVQEGPGGRLVVIKAPDSHIFGGIRGRVILEGEQVPLPRVRVEIVGTPSHFRILDTRAESRQFLSREEVSQMPHIADDLYRAVKRLPGASGGDVSAQFNVRGGATDEMLVILDGMEIYEPFHLKDFQNIFSTVDAEANGGNQGGEQDRRRNSQRILRRSHQG